MGQTSLWCLAVFFFMRLNFVCLVFGGQNCLQLACWLCLIAWSAFRLLRLLRWVVVSCLTQVVLFYVSDVERYLRSFVSHQVQDLEDELASLKARHEALRTQAKAVGVDLSEDDEAEAIFEDKRYAKQPKRAADEERCHETREVNDSLGEELPAHEREWFWNVMLVCGESFSQPKQSP